MANLFFVYSHVDEQLRDTLEKHLTIMKRQGRIDAWHDRRLRAGDHLDGEISRNLEQADVILLLVSPDFFASNYIYDVEMKRAMERHEAGEARVIPVILRHRNWRATPLGKLVAVPKDGRPVKAWPDIDEAFLDISKAIEAALVSVDVNSTVSASAPQKKVSSGKAHQIEPRSSNLRARKQFKESDKDSFIEEAFEYMARFFENSLAELELRNEGLSTKFRLIDATKFTAVVYRDGTAVARCKIVLGGMFGKGISYSNNDSASDSSWNDNLTAEAG